jgi:hypothetical protein
MALQFVSSQIKDLAIDSAKIANSTITSAQIALGGSFAFTGAMSSSAVPLSANDIANKSYVDSIASGLHWKDSVKATTTGNITLSGTQTVDGIALSADDRILVKDQTTASQNGIYVVAAGAWARSADMDVAGEFPGAAMFVREGSLNADSGWVCSNDSVNVGVTAVVFAQFSGAGQITAGAGLAKAGNVLSVNVDDTSLQITGDSLNVKAAGVTDAMLAGSISNAKLTNNSITIASGTGMTGGGSTALGGTVTLNVGGLVDAQIAAGAAIAYSKLALSASVKNADLAGSIADDKLLAISTANKVEGSAIELGTNPGLQDSSGLALKLISTGAMLTTGDGLGVKLNGSSLSLGVNGISIATDGVINSMITDSTIANAKLANDSMTIASGNGLTGGGATALGGTATLTVDLDGGTLTLGAAGVKVSAAGIGTTEIGDGVVSSPKLSFQPRKEGYGGNGSATAFNLTTQILDANWYDGILVSRNGQVMKQVASGAADNSEYVVSDNGSVTTVTFGAAPENGDVILTQYYA